MRVNLIFTRRNTIHFNVSTFREDLEKLEKEQLDDSRHLTTAAGLATVLTKTFQVRPVSLDRVPTFVAKDKSNFKARLLNGKSRKMQVRGHHFVAHQYFTVTYCNHCQLIIGGIGPQGYRCSGMLIFTGENYLGKRKLPAQ